MNSKLISNSNYVLRNVINKEECLDILQNFIESFLEIKISKIILRPYLGRKVKYLPPEEKYGIANVRITTENQEEFNIGIQFIDGLYIQEKILTYGAMVHANQEEYVDFIKKAHTITINIVNSKCFASSAEHKVIKLGKKEMNTIEKENFEFHILELSKFKRMTLRNAQDAWMAYLKGDNEELIRKAKEEYNIIKKLDELLIQYWEKEIL